MANGKRFLRGRARRLANVENTDQDYELMELDLARMRRFNELVIPNKVPPEIRNHIIRCLCAPRFFNHHRRSDGLRVHWFPAHIHELPVPIFLEGVANWWTSKRIIIELPDFIPNHKGLRCPSAIHIHDTSYEFSVWCTPPFMSWNSVTSFSTQYLDLNDFEDCPFWLFSSITIQIPPAGQDQASIIMNWNRLRYIGHALHHSLSRVAKKNHEKDLRYSEFLRKSPPDIKIQFLDQASRSWLDSQGELRVSLDTVRHFLADGFDAQPSDLVVLLRALAPVRGARRIGIDIPFDLQPSEQQRKFSVKWFENEQAQKYPFGEYMELGGWNDRDSFEWLQRCELVLHLTLHSLDTKLAGYLRIEQMAYLTPSAVFRLFNHASRYGDHVQTTARRHIKAMILYRYLHTPKKNCGCWACTEIMFWKGRIDSWGILQHWYIHGIPAEERISRRSWRWLWMMWKDEWERESQAVHDRLQIASDNAGK